MALPDRQTVRGWAGRMIVDRAGAAIGTCIQVYTDDASGLPEWAAARIGETRVLLPLLDAVEDGDRVRVAVSRDDALLAPRPAAGGHVSPAEEEHLYRHYGIPFSGDASPTVLPSRQGQNPDDGSPARDAATPSPEVQHPSGAGERAAARAAPARWGRSRLAAGLASARQSRGWTPATVGLVLAGLVAAAGLAVARVSRRARSHRRGAGASAHRRGAAGRRRPLKRVGLHADSR
ncbi:MAG TPA: hypothetical protein VI248_28930 [Kineosporiaceae bacterium]